LPFLPDESAIEACEACSAIACKAERDACLEDDACTAQLICMGECDDPGCREECRGTVALSEFSPFYDDLFGCTYRECPDACQERENWGCLDDFRWPQTEERSLDAYVRFATGRYGIGNSVGIRDVMAGATAWSCSADIESCGSNSLQDPVLVDEKNGAHLKLYSATIQGYFDGSFQIEGPENGPRPLRLRLHSWPLAYGGTFEADSISAYVNQTAGLVPSSNAATVWAVQHDCTLRGSNRISFQIVERQDAEVRHVQGSQLLASASEGDGVAVFVGVPMDQETEVVTVRAFRAGEPDPIAQRSVQIRAGWVSNVLLLPRSKSGR
jgi:hypothetical protein